MMSKFFVVSLIFLLANGTSAGDEILLSKLANLEKCSNATTDLMMTMVNAINNLAKKVDRLISSQEKFEPKGIALIYSFRHVTILYF